MDTRKAVGRATQGIIVAAVIIIASAGAIGIAYAGNGEHNSWDRAWHDARLVAGVVTGTATGFAITGN